MCGNRRAASDAVVVWTFALFLVKCTALLPPWEDEGSASVENFSAESPEVAGGSNSLNSVFYPDASESADDMEQPCRTDSGLLGICVRLSKCPAVRVSLWKEKPVVCDYDGLTPIVCCPRKSEKEDYRYFYRRAQLLPKRSEYSQCGRFYGAELLRFGPGRPRRSVNLISPHVIGGSDADYARWPWMAIIGETLPNGEKSWFCGGMLINNRYVLTAAHCVTTKKVDTVRLGEYNLVRTDDGASRDILVDRTIVHPDFHYPALYNDIALIRLRYPVRFSNDVRPVCLPPAHIGLLGGRPVTLTGWGRTELGGDELSDVLQEVNLRVTTVSACRSSYDGRPEAGRSFPEGVKSTQICASVPEGGKDACMGDSGGPLVYYNTRTDRYVAVGIVSGGIGCGLAAFPGVYTRVSSYLDWIKNNVD